MALSPLSSPEQALGLLDGLSQLVELVDDGEGGLTALQFTAELAQAATGAEGATFTEYTATGARIVVTTQSLAWALGRPIPVSHPAAGRVLTGPRVQQVRSADLDPDSARQLVGRGLHRFIRAAAISEGSVIGALQVFFGDPDGQVERYQLSVARLLAAAAGHLYRESPGLPVYPDGPALNPIAQGMAVVGTDGRVRSWSPGAAHLTGAGAGEMLGELLPFPLPATGDTLVYRLRPGRWIKVRAVGLTGTDATVVTFQATPGPEPGGADLFIAATSHELRTPVTVIRGYTDTLIEHWEALDEATRREAVTRVALRARELADLVDRLLTAATDMAGLVEPAAPAPFDLVRALRAVVDELTPELRTGLHVELPESLPTAMGDRTTIPTVLTELLTNACKYSSERVEVQLTAGADAYSVWFRVADRGIGVHPDHAERAFEQFWQRDVTDQRRYGGVGLGLYLVRRMVERQHGWVSLRPRDGGGTVAEVRLQRMDVSPQGV